MNRPRATRSQPLALLVTAGLLLGACGGSGDTAEPVRTESSGAPATTTGPIADPGAGASDDATPPDEDDPVPSEVEGRPITPNGPAEIASTRDRLARAMGIRPAFDAVVFAIALGYDYTQIETASRTGDLLADGSILEGGVLVTPAGPPAPGPQGLRAAAAPPVGLGTMAELWQELARWKISPTGEGATDGGIVSIDIEHKELFALEAMILFVAAGMDLDEVIGFVLLGIPPSCESVRFERYLQRMADKVCVDQAIGEAATTTTTSTTVAPTTSAPAEDAAEDGASGGADDGGAGTSVDGPGDGERTYVGTVQFDLGIGAGTPAVNELFLIATASGLVGTYEYQAAGDGYCIAATANLDDEVVLEVAPGQYSGPVEILATVWDGPCGSGESEVIPFTAQLEGRLEGQQIVGTLDESGQILPFTATLSDVG